MTAPTGGEPVNEPATGDGDGPENTTTTTEQEPEPGPVRPQTDQRAGSEDDTTKQDKPSGETGASAETDDGTDWQAKATEAQQFSRKWEDRAKANKKEADRAAQENAQLKQTLEALRKALDPDGAAQEEDPGELAEKATRERDAKDAELRQLRLEQAAEKAGRTAGADVDALLDSRGFATKLHKLDPTGDDFDDELKSLVTKALEDNPRLKAPSPAPTRSVTDGAGTRDDKGQLTRADLASMTPDQITKARREGRLTSLGVGTG